MAKDFKGVQLDILNSNASNQLVSAGAGSGKTTVMIEKISRLILSKQIPLENLLVVTFTVLAAGEMKDRLVKVFQAKLQETDDLTEKEFLLNLIEQTKTASIDTIDGFSSKTIKKYFYELNMSPNFEIISEATKDYYLNRTMKKTINDFSLSGDGINILLDLFGGKNRSLKNLERIVLDLYTKVINIQDYNSFLDDCLNQYVDSKLSEKIVNDKILEEVEKLKHNLIENYVEEFKDRFDLSFVCLNEINGENLKENLTKLQTIALPKFTAKEKADFVGLEDVAAVCDEFEKFTKNLEDNGIDANFDKKNEKIVEYFTLIVKILKNFIENYNNLKQKNNLIDFNDLNRLMLKLLENKNVLAELQNKYKYIAIDEYQDVNLLQDSLMSKLVGKDTTLFMVGDVKQSIYGFRGASPEWFLKKYDNYQITNSGEVFKMRDNYRSNPLIMGFVDEVFSQIMTKKTGDIDYVADCTIDAHRKDIVDQKVKILLAKTANEEKQIASNIYSVKNHIFKDENANCNQALLVMEQINSLVGSEFYDADAKRNRILNFEDIAILVRSEQSENYENLISMLQANNVPINIESKLDIISSEGIKLVLSILKCIINTADDVDFLAAFFALTNLNIDDITVMRDKSKTLLENLIENKNNQQISLGFDILQDIKNNSYTKTNSELIRYILNNKKLKYYILQMENGEKELKLIEEFLNQLSSLEDNLGLAEFVEVVESNISKSGSFKQTDNEHSINILTIHKSKGLEYPVVILFDASKQLAFVNENDTINFNADIGIGVDYFDTSTRTKCYSLTKYAIKTKNFVKGYKEEMRLLYVALTRAKNKLIITGEYDDNIFASKFKHTSFLNMILSCYKNKIDKATKIVNLPFCEIVFEDEFNVLSFNHSAKKYKNIYENFVYDTSKFEIPFKNSVTGLNSEFSIKHKFETKQWLNAKIQVNADEDKALQGTHYHQVLEKLDLQNPYKKPDELQELKDVDSTLIELAHKQLSPLAKDAINIKHEAEFMMYVPYNEIIKSNITDKVLIQGVVDLIIEHQNSITIVDYKFSTLDINILKQKYAEQLELYKLAVEKAFNKKVEHIYIYSIKTGLLA